jgi:hypothetical protein
MKLERLRKATMQDVENVNNRIFYFIEGFDKTIISKIQRRVPEDYQNYNMLKSDTPEGKKTISQFIESCQWDWITTTKRMKSLLSKQNLYIETK